MENAKAWNHENNNSNVSEDGSKEGKFDFHVNKSDRGGEEDESFGSYIIYSMNKIIDKYDQVTDGVNKIVEKYDQVKDDVLKRAKKEGMEYFIE